MRESGGEAQAPGLVQSLVVFEVTRTVFFSFILKDTSRPTKYDGLGLLVEPFVLHSHIYAYYMLT